MKIRKIIPLLAATALLTGCNLFKSSESFNLLNILKKQHALKLMKNTKTV